MPHSKNNKSDTVTRFQKPSIKNPKLVFGMMLIALSILAVVLVLRIGNKTEPYYVAKKDIAVGAKVSSTDFELINVRLADASSQYIPEGYDFSDQQFATTYIHSGEIVRKDALNTTKDDSRREVVITLDSSIASHLNPSDRVDIWVSEKEENSQQYHDPKPLMLGAEINQKNSQESIIGGTGKTAVSLLVTEESLPRILNAINNQAKISLIPTSYVGNQP